jgi:Ca2+-binding RTX toxin-like protein
VIEKVGQGIDRVMAATDYTLTAGSEVEWLQAGSDAGLKLTGNAFANAILGGAGNDTLNGGGGCRPVVRRRGQ